MAELCGFFNERDAREILGIDSAALDTLVKVGRLVPLVMFPSVRLGHSYIFERAEIEALATGMP